MDVEGAYDALLGDLHTHVQQLDEVHRDPFLLIARNKQSTIKQDNPDYVPLQACLILLTTIKNC